MNLWIQLPTQDIPFVDDAKYALRLNQTMTSFKLNYETCTVPSESSHIPELVPHFVVLQPELKMDYIITSCKV